MPTVEITTTKQSTAQRVSGHLQLRRLASGPAWFVKSRVPGRTPEQTTRRLGPAHLAGGKPPAGALTKRQAQDALADLLADERRKVGERAYEHRAAGATFQDAAVEYLRYIEVDRERDAQTVRDYAGVVHGYLLPWFGERPLESITHRDVTAYRDALKEKGRALRKMPDGEEREGKLSNRTIVRHLIVCHSVFKRARQKWDHLPPNPAAAELVERPPVVYDGSFDVLDPDEVRLVAEQAADEQTRVLYLLAPFTGLREGECFALRWRHVDFAVGRLRVEENWTDKRLKMTKGKKARSVPMTDEVMAMLDGLSRRGYLDGPDDLVFPAPGGGYLDDMAVRRQWYKDLKAAKVRRVRFHDLRHTFGTQGVQVLPVTDVQALMGHAHISTTQRYIHYKPGHEEGAKLGEAFSAGRVPNRVPNRDDSGVTERN